MREKKLETIHLCDFPLFLRQESKIEGDRTGHIALFLDGLWSEETFDFKTFRQKSLQPVHIKMRH